MSSATVSSAATPSSFYSMNGTMSMNGTEFASGLDTQSLIKALTANISSQIDTEKQMEQKTEWKRSMYQDVETMLQKFSDTYFSYASGSSTNIMSKSFFSGANFVSSNPSVVTASGSRTDAGNLTIDSITQLATAASYMSGQVSNEAINSTAVIGTSSSYFNLSVGGQSYTLQLGKNYTTSTLTASDLATQLNTQIGENANLNGKVSFSANNGSIQISGTSVSITGASKNLIDGLSMTSGTDGAGNTVYTLGSSMDVNKFCSLKDQLDGSTLTVNLDGVNKTISFGDAFVNGLTNGVITYGDNADGVASYLQNQMNTVFGSGKVSVGASSGGLSIQTTAGYQTSVLEIVSSSNADVLGTDGLLRIGAGETNRLELDKTLDELNSTSELHYGQIDSGTRTENGNSVSYCEFAINGKTFDFDTSTKLSDVIDKINSDPTANVTVSYSQTLDKFRIVSKDTGSQGQINIQDTVGHLGNALFGGGTATAGTDLKMAVKLDGGTDQNITRSTNSFTLDGISLNVNGSFNVANVTPPPDGPITFSGSDTDDLYKKISDFVDQYNAIIDKLNTYVATEPPSQATTAGGGTDYEPLTDDQKKTMTDAEITDWNTKAQQGLLFSDPELTSLQTSIRTAMEGNIASVGSSLASIGISTQPLDYTSGGKLVIDDTKLKNELSTEPDKVQQLFTNADGISSKLRNVLTNNIGYSGASGILYNIAGSSTATGADDSEFGQEIKDYDKQIKDLQTQLTDKQNNLQAKFTQMEMLISQLSSQSNYLSSMTSS